MKRECGGCTLCCVLPEIPELNKVCMESCEHKTGKGCAAYDARPRVCRVFQCMWLNDPVGWFRTKDRPDRLGVYFRGEKFAQTTPSGTRFPFIEVFAKSAKALDNGRVKRLIAQFARNAVVSVKVPPKVIEFLAPLGYTIHRTTPDGLEFVVFDKGAKIEDFADAERVDV